MRNRSVRSLYELWLGDEYFDEDTKKELLSIKDDPSEIEERFYKDLEFGTGGLRGIIGAGTNRMNIYTVRKVSQGLSRYLLKNVENTKSRGIVIAYDSRHKSAEFALEAAKIFAANGIVAYLFDELRPTPELSFAVRHLKAAAGVVVTASHNPKQYNGYKVYGEDGGQLPLEASEAVLSEVEAVSDITSVIPMDESEAYEKGLIKKIGPEIDDAYINSLKTLVVDREAIDQTAASIKIVYTPLHGSGNKPVRRILSEIGFKNVLVVKEQELPDPEFPTVKYPNPEEAESLKLAMELAHKEDADLIIGTDPDSDRMGIAVKNRQGEFIVLTGNQIGCLLLEYILSQKKRLGTLPANGFTVKTIVSTELARKIALYYGVEMIEVLTGFKFIGEKIKDLDDTGLKKYIFGFEESHGYLAGTFARDKDAVVASMLAAEMAAYYKARGMTIYDGLIEIYNRYGYCFEEVTSFALEGKEGVEKINAAMDAIRREKGASFAECTIEEVRDYLTGETVNLESGQKDKTGLPSSNVLYYRLKDSAWFCIRPSGTEPKIKIYFGSAGKSADEAKERLNSIKEKVLGEIKKLLF